MHRHHQNQQRKQNISNKKRIKQIRGQGQNHHSDKHQNAHRHHKTAKKRSDAANA
jgi:hypothetical protein